MKITLTIESNDIQESDLEDLLEYLNDGTFESTKIEISKLDWQEACMAILDAIISQEGNDFSKYWKLPEERKQELLNIYEEWSNKNDP